MLLKREIEAEYKVARSKIISGHGTIKERGMDYNV